MGALTTGRSSVDEDSSRFLGSTTPQQLPLDAVGNHRQQGAIRRAAPSEISVTAAGHGTNAVRGWHERY